MAARWSGFHCISVSFAKKRGERGSKKSEKGAKISSQTFALTLPQMTSRTKPSGSTGGSSARFLAWAREWGLWDGG